MKTISLVVLIFLVFNTKESYSQETENIDIEQQLDTYRKKNEGYSHISTKSKKMWDRSCGNIVDKKDWFNNAYGLIVHSTGRSIIKAGFKKRQKKGSKTLYDPNRIINRGKMIYNKKRAINYILGWGGIESGHLIQIGNENKKCSTKKKCKCYSGVSMSEQRKHIEKNKGFGKELKQNVDSMWKERWKGYETPLHLIPKGGIKNSFIQVECIPLPKENILYKPLKEGLWFTKEQHDAVALLACDIAIRNGWDLDTEWWKSNRLLGHEDLSPVTRSSSTQLYIDNLTLFTKDKKRNRYIINKKSWGSKVPKSLAKAKFTFKENLSNNTNFVEILTGKFKHKKFKRNKIKVYKKKIESWDPGFLRDNPRFDWNYVYDRIKEIRDKNYKELISLFQRK